MANANFFGNEILIDFKIRPVKHLCCRFQLLQKRDTSGFNLIINRGDVVGGEDGVYLGFFVAFQECQNRFLDLRAVIKKAGRNLKVMLYRRRLKKYAIVTRAQFRNIPTQA